MTSSSIPKRVSFLTAVLLFPLASPVVHAQSVARYEAVFFDGTRVDGDKVSGWHKHPGSPRIDNTTLFDARRPLRWLRDRRLKPWQADERCPGYIEFVGGDRLVGRVIEVGPGGETDGPYVPAHLLVKPPAALHLPVRVSPACVRVLPGRIQRVVFGPASRRRLRPGTLYCLDGRRLGFVRLRWQKDSVVLLLKDGTCEVKLSEIEEAHLPQIDPWQAYYKELAILSPACRSRLMRIETTGGLIATGSDLRFGAVPYSTPGQKQRVMKHLKQLDEQISRMQNDLKGHRKKLDEAGAKFARESAKLKEQFEAAQKAYKKTKGEMRRRIDQGKKDDAARLAGERQKIDREFRSADEAMVKRTAGEEPPKRDNLLKAFRLKQAQLRKTRVKSLQDARIKSERQKQKALERFTKQEMQKLKRMEADLPNRTNQLKARLDRATAKWEQRLRSLEQVKSQRATSLGGHNESDTWCHMVQPVWSLDVLWVPFRSIHTRWSFAPEQVPLCRVRPAATVSPPLLPGRTNRNSAGRPLHSGGQQYAWGFGVHAYSELRFPLPKCAKAFRSRVGLDRIVGPGGCVRARVYVGSTRDKPVYEGPLLVGSKKTVDTGSVRLHLPSEGPGHLVLQADPADRDSPPGADPLNIRDKLDWLDPRLELDTTGLRDQVRRQIGPLIGASQGWKLALDRRGVYTWTSHFDETRKPGEGRFLTMLRAQGQPLKLSRGMTIGPTDKWLAVHVGLPTGKNPRPDAIFLHIGEKQVQPRKIPIRQLWQDRPTPLVFGLDEYQGKKITLELTQPAGGKPLHWQAVSTLAVPPPAYRLVDIMELVGKSDMQVPYELGRALQSNRIARQEKLAALEVNQLGGIVNFAPSPMPGVPLDRLTNILVGRDWTGGDKTFVKTLITFKKMPSLKTLLVTKDSGVSDGAIAKLQAEMPKLTINRFIKRIPSADGGRSSPITWRNHYRKKLVVLWVDSQGKLNFSINRHLEAGQELKRHAFAGVRYETHYHRKDYANATDYTFIQPLSTFVVVFNGVWEIKPGGR